MIGAHGDISGTINNGWSTKTSTKLEILAFSARSKPCAASVADETRPGRSVPCLDSVDAEDILPKWYPNSEQDWLFENLTIDRMPSKHPIKSKDYGGQLRRPGENLEGSTPQDDVPQETSSVSNQSENGENIARLLVVIVCFSISATAVFS